MDISFKNVIPDPLKSVINPESDVWNRTFDFKSGQNYLIDAQSGKGKSTFVQSIYGIRKDYEGSIFYGADEIKSLSKDNLAKLRQSNFSILFQDLRLFPDLTAEENIVIKSLLDKTEQFDRLHEMAETLKVTHILHKQAGLLSYGERQRIATIRALIQPFDWIMLDEPFAHLDKENTLNSFNLICEVAKKNAAGILLTTLGEDDFVEFPNNLNL